MGIDWLSFFFGAVSAVAASFVIVFVIAFKQYAKQKSVTKK